MRTIHWSYLLSILIIYLLGLAPFTHVFFSSPHSGSCFLRWPWKPFLMLIFIPRLLDGPRQDSARDPTFQPLFLCAFYPARSPRGKSAKKFWMRPTKICTERRRRWADATTGDKQDWLRQDGETGGQRETSMCVLQTQTQTANRTPRSAQFFGNMNSKRKDIITGGLWRSNIVPLLH